MRMTQPAMRRLRPAAGVLALAGIAGLAAPASTALASAGVPVLTAIHAGHRHGYDQIVFQFAGGLPARRSVSYVAGLPGSGAGTLASVVGRARLLVSFSGASGRDSQGNAAYGPARRSYALRGVIQVVAVQDSQNVVSFGVGLARREPFRVRALANPSRIVIDVPTPYRTAGVSDFFVNSGSAGGQAVTVPARRPVIRPATAARALHRLFAGPTQAELARGLRFVTSGATGFSRLTIRHGVARVQLTGGCSSGGSTVTVATEIMPTLRQFPSVQWVKVYDPAGRTTQPAGHTNSIPACLRPSALRLFAARHKGLVTSMLVAALIIAGLGILLGLVLSALSVLTGLALRPDLITASAYRAERVKAKPVGPGQFEPDPALPGYPFRQVRADLSRIGANRRARYRKLWSWPGRPFFWILLLPVSAAAVSCLLVAGLTTITLAVLVALVAWSCAAIAAAALAATAVLLRGAERSWLKVMRTEASCPRCYLVTPRPAYRCPGCSALHRDIRPGRQGVLGRRCGCGALLPTTVLRAARRLEAVCQRCETPLRPGSAALRDVRIPIFGDTSAGKTRFLYAGLDSLIDTTSRARIAFGFPDEDSQNQATTALDLIRSGQDTVKTSATLPTALTCQVGTGPRSTLVHLFDAAGEDFRGAQMHDALGFLDNGHGLVYVLDPFSIGSVRDRMAGQNAEAIRLAHAAAGDPEIAYGEVVSRLRDSGVAAEGQRLAIVVSKVDLLKKGGLELPGDSDAIAEWLTEMGVHNLVLSAQREFAEARYFTVASLAATETNRFHDPGAPLRWLLSARGVRLPASPPPAGSPHTRGRRPPDPADQVSAGQGETAKVQP
jgi:hypothetical protein